MNRILTLLSILLLTSQCFGQSFAPPPGYPGSTAIHKDSSIFVGWGAGAQIVRGPMNIANPGLGDVTHGMIGDALGIADDMVVSLGDGGEALVMFSSPIINGPGPDFAVFENGFGNNYMEFAHVEVSSDGLNFYRFPSISEAPTDNQLGNFSFSDCAFFNNLAGKYRVYYGTPFDLEELTGVSGLNVNNITHVRLIDVVGSINPMYGSFDSQGTIINDPYPSEFASGGFDLDAIGVIHNAINSIEEEKLEIGVYPNPANDRLYCQLEGVFEYSITSLSGEQLVIGQGKDLEQISIGTLSPGVYFLNIKANDHVNTVKFLKK